MAPLASDLTFLLFSAPGHLRAACAQFAFPGRA